jgi:GT2 family glycosyltransferase
VFQRLYARLLESADALVLRPIRALLVLPRLLYMEAETERLREKAGSARTLTPSPEGIHEGICRFFRRSETVTAFLLPLPERGADAPHLCRIGNSAFILRAAAAPPAGGAECLRLLEEEPSASLRHAMQEALLASILDAAPRERDQEAVRESIRALQYGMPRTPCSATAAEDSFNLHWDYVVPVGNEGVFVSGWMRDPLHALESLEAISDLGFRLEMKPLLFRTARPDIEEAYRDSPFGRFSEKHGLVAFVPLSAEQKRACGDLAQLAGFRFVAHLAGGSAVEICPPRQWHDAFSARDLLLKLIHPDQVSDLMLERCIGAAAAHLHRACMESVRVTTVHEIGTQRPFPRISLIVPLYKRLEFIRVQYATLANDPGMAECELIYVLDSPWQEAEACEMLREYSNLYRLPARLVVMERNSGYAAATNAGARHASGAYLVLLNSDVFPTAPGWAGRMADFYASRPQMGALAPKLLYEDDSVQHAGMFFARTTTPFWLNLHYYKGYPRAFPAAGVSRPVPAVTGACLMVSRTVWEQIGGLSVDYVIGDFEDSDFCLRCADAGLENWYFAEVELYHLERQSVSLNAGHTEGIAWRYNARLHSARWGQVIENMLSAAA